MEKISGKLMDLFCELCALEEEHENLKKLLKHNGPVCPICKKKMIPVNYSGYYDSFSYWECECNNFENGEQRNGAYS